MKAAEARTGAELERMIGNIAFPEFVVSLLRVQNALIARAEQFMPAGMTVARWQIMKAMSRLGGSATVPAIARELMLTRQAVQRQVDLMRTHELVLLRDNPAHRRSPNVSLTSRGHTAYVAANQRWFWLAGSLGDPLQPGELERAREVLEALTAKLSEGSEPADTE
jgi:DNA-binding MarR family transcriptional regulator